MSVEENEKFGTSAFMAARELVIIILVPSARSPMQFLKHLAAGCGSGAGGSAAPSDTSVSAFVEAFGKCVGGGAEGRRPELVLLALALLLIEFRARQRGRPADIASSAAHPSPYGAPFAPSGVAASVVAAIEERLLRTSLKACAPRDCLVLLRRALDGTGDSARSACQRDSWADGASYEEAMRRRVCSGFAHFEPIMEAEVEASRPIRTPAQVLESHPQSVASFALAAAGPMTVASNCGAIVANLADLLRAVGLEKETLEYVGRLIAAAPEWVRPGGSILVFGHMAHSKGAIYSRPQARRVLVRAAFSFAALSTLRCKKRGRLRLHCTFVTLSAASAPSSALQGLAACGATGAKSPLRCGSIS
jgi:hypothetical protein